MLESPFLLYSRLQSSAAAWYLYLVPSPLWDCIEALPYCVFVGKTFGLFANHFPFALFYPSIVPFKSRQGALFSFIRVTFSLGFQIFMCQYGLSLLQTYRLPFSAWGIPISLTSSQFVGPSNWKLGKTVSHQVICYLITPFWRISETCLPRGCSFVFGCFICMDNLQNVILLNC